MSFVDLVQSGKVTELLLYFSFTFFIINKLVLITTCPQHDPSIPHFVTYTVYAITRNIQTNQEQNTPKRMWVHLNLCFMATILLL